MRRFFSWFFFLIVFLGLGYVLVRYYSYIFAKDVVGEIVAVERMIQPTAIISGLTPESSSQIFSFAVAIKSDSGEIFTASSEDRQWAIVQKGQCAEAKFFPYPPWQFDKSGTFFGARLVRLYECGAK